MLLVMLRMLWMLWMVLLLVVMVVVDHSRSRVVRRMVVWRRQTLGLVGVMLEKEEVSATSTRAVAKARCSVCNDVMTIWARVERIVKLDDGWSAGRRDVIRLMRKGGEELEQRYARAGFGKRLDGRVYR